MGGTRDVCGFWNLILVYRAMAFSKGRRQRFNEAFQ